MVTAGNRDDAQVLVLRALAVSAGDVKLLKDLDVHVDTGELVALNGPSGCGKTTLLRAVAGLVDVSAGEVLFQGNRPDDVGWPAFRRQVVLVNQQPCLLDGTVEHNLRRPFQYESATAAYPEERVELLLDRFRLGKGCLDQGASSLSVGQQQRVCLIRAMLLEPVVLLLDEPTSALDEAVKADVEDVVRTEAEQGAFGVLVVTHDREQVARWCHRCIELAPHMARRAERVAL